MSWETATCIAGSSNDAGATTIARCVCARGHVGREDGAGVPEGPAPRADAVQVGLEGGERRRGPRDAVDGDGDVRDARPLLLVEAELFNFVLRVAPAGLPRSPWTPEGPLPEGLGKFALAELARDGGPPELLGAEAHEAPVLLAAVAAARRLAEEDGETVAPA